MVLIDDVEAYGDASDNEKGVERSTENIEPLLRCSRVKEVCENQDRTQVNRALNERSVRTGETRVEVENRH